jgi:2-enoate reductase
MKYKSLNTPINLKNIELKNRIVLSPMGIGIYNEDESVPDEYISFIQMRSRATGLVVTTGVRVSDRFSKFRFMGCYSDSHVPGMKRLAAAAHGQDTPVFLQILALGGADPSSPWVPSANIPQYKEEWEGEAKPRELETAQIEELVQAFVRAALLAQEAGFDGVELDAAENFLLSDLICPYTNRRPDRYGGSFENRMSAPVEIVHGIQKACEDNFLIGFKFNAFYDLPDGIDLDLGARIAVRMAKEGVCYIHEWSFAKLDRPMSLFKYTPMPNLYQPRNSTITVARFIRSRLREQGCDTPVITVGGIVKPEEADGIIAEGSADMVAVGRGFIADGLWAYSALKGKRIRPCIRCHVCHHEVAVEGKAVVCSINPDPVGLTEMKKIRRARDVMVVGGGPAGIIAALTASKRGHRVTLYEKQGEVGGMLIPGSAPDFKHEFGDLLTYFREEVADSCVALFTGKAVTPELIKEKKPDLLIVAVGAVPLIPEIPGMEKGNVLTAVEVLKNARQYTGKRIVVIGGGDVGCETALLLSRNGNDVRLVEILPSLMETEPIEHNTAVLEAMILNAGIIVQTESEVVRVAKEYVTIRDRSGKQSEIPCDLTVVAVGMMPHTSLVEELRRSCTSSYAVGDCVKPQRLRHAVEEGYRIGNAL